MRAVGNPGTPASQALAVHPSRAVSPASGGWGAVHSVPGQPVSQAMAPTTPVCGSWAGAPMGLILCHMTSPVCKAVAPPSWSLTFPGSLTWARPRGVKQGSVCRTGLLRLALDKKDTSLHLLRNLVPRLSVHLEMVSSRGGLREAGGPLKEGGGETAHKTLSVPGSCG